MYLDNQEQYLWDIQVCAKHLIKSVLKIISLPVHSEPLENAQCGYQIPNERGLYHRAPQSTAVLPPCATELAGVNTLRFKVKQRTEIFMHIEARIIALSKGSHWCSCTASTSRLRLVWHWAKPCSYTWSEVTVKQESGPDSTDFQQIMLKRMHQNILLIYYWLLSLYMLRYPE